MTIIEKIEAIKTLKNYVVKFQMYELAAWLRDREKKLLHDYSEKTNSEYEHTIMKFTYKQYEYCLETLDSYGLSRNNESTKIIREKMKMDCIEILRDQKIDDILN